MANKTGTPSALGVTPLLEGEKSAPVRVRAPVWVFERLRGRSAAEVGKLLGEALAAEGKGGEVHLVETRRRSGRLAEQVPALRVLSAHVPRSLRWRPERAAEVERLLGQGERLTADGVNWRTAAGELLGWRLAEALADAGTLEPEGVSAEAEKLADSLPSAGLLEPPPA